jgi:uncharacterized protein (DUF302 family)
MGLGLMVFVALGLWGCGGEKVDDDLEIDTVGTVQPERQRLQFVIKPSLYDHDETLQRAYAALDRRDLTVFAVIDHSANAAEAGLALKPSAVVVFGSAQIGTPLMQAAPIASAVLPLRMAIYENREGEVMVAVPSIRAVRDGIPGLETQGERLDAIARNLGVLLDEVTGDGEG